MYKDQKINVIFFPFLKTLRLEEINHSNDHPFTSTPVFFPVHVLSSKILQQLQLLDGFYVMLQFA